MVNDIITAISKKIDQVFGNGFKIYTEKVNQGFSAPCFFIKIINSSHKKLISKRYFKELPLDIHYFPSSEDINSETLGVAEKLYEDLEYLNLDNGMVHGTEMRHEVVDDVLHFLINYDLLVYKSTNGDKMQTLTKDVNV